MTTRGSILAVAPMMDWTDRHCRFFHRLLAPHARLYTEMVTTGAVLFGPRARLLDHSPAEHPVALQLGGADPAQLAAATAEGVAWGYDEINLNCGCPSDRVQAARFGACLMAEPDLVAACVRAMQDAAGTVPVTVKCRIGIDASDDWPFLQRFVARLADAGCRTVIIHARKAWLSGLSPKQNREIPPLVPERARQVKEAFPQLTVVLNGGLVDLAGVVAALDWADGVMLGRAAYQDPWLLTTLEQALQGTPPPDPAATVARMADYAAERMAAGTPLAAVTRHMLGLFNGRPGARAWRRALGEEARRPGAGPALLLEAADRVLGQSRAAA